MSTENGTGDTTIYVGATGKCYNAITGGVLPAGSILTNITEKTAEAITIEVR